MIDTIMWQTGKYVCAGFSCVGVLGTVDLTLATEAVFATELTGTCPWRDSTEGVEAGILIAELLLFEEFVRDNGVTGTTGDCAAVRGETSPLPVLFSLEIGVNGADASE